MFVWQGQGQPTTLYALLSGLAADASWLPNDPGASASDGLGDPQQSGYPYTLSSGGHLVQKAAPAGSGYGTVLRLDLVTLSAGNSGGGFQYVSLTAQGDSRAVMIGSDFGQTFYKGSNGQPAPNVRQSDGSMVDDTVVPGTFSSFVTGVTTGATYSNITPSSNWGANSNYLWQSSLLPVTAEGAFNQTLLGFNVGVQDVPDFGLAYNNPPASDGSSDTIKLTLTDAVDGAIGSNTYTIRFHNQYPKGRWEEDPASPTIHPTPTNGPTGPASNLLGEWKEVGPYTNDGTENLPVTVTVTNSGQTSTQTNISIADTDTTTTTGSIGVPGTLGAGVNNSQAFQVNTGVTLGENFTVTVAQSTTVTTKPGYQSYLFWGPGVNERFGTCDVYAANGYQGNTTWTLKQPQSLGSNSQAILFKVLSVPAGAF